MQRQAGPIVKFRTSSRQDPLLAGNMALFAHGFAYGMFEPCRVYDRVIRAFDRIQHEEQRFDTANLDVTNIAIRVNQLIATMMPVMMMMDECVGHMTEKVVIPKAEEIEIAERRFTKAKPGEYLPYHTNGDMVPYMAKAGDGHRFHVTGLTHDERGYPAMNADAQEKCVRRLVGKIRNNADKLTAVEESGTVESVVRIVGSPCAASGC